MIMIIIARYFWSTFAWSTANRSRRCRINMIFVHHVQLFAITVGRKRGLSGRLKLKSFTCQNMHVREVLYMSNVRLGPFVDKPEEYIC